MSIYRLDAAGISTRGPGEPCGHPRVAIISYSDEGGAHTRCRSCGTTINWAPAPRVEQCCRCGAALTAQDPATTTLGPRCRGCW